MRRSGGRKGKKEGKGRHTPLHPGMQTQTAVLFHIRASSHIFRNPSCNTKADMSQSKRQKASPSASGDESRQFACQLCHKTYERADHLNRHLDSRESMCCALIFFANSKLISPPDRNERTFKCSHCPRGFNRR